MRARSLADLSSLTNVQVETIKLHQAVHKNEISMPQALQMRKKSAISKGTHYRIISQARRRIKKSILTTAVAVQLGLVSAEDVQKLITIASRVPPNMDSETTVEVVAITDALADRIVML